MEYIRNSDGEVEGLHLLTWLDCTTRSWLLCLHENALTGLGLTSPRHPQHQPSEFSMWCSSCTGGSRESGASNLFPKVTLLGKGRGLTWSPRNLSPKSLDFQEVIFVFIILISQLFKRSAPERQKERKTSVHWSLPKWLGQAQARSLELPRGPPT